MIITGEPQIKQVAIHHVAVTRGTGRSQLNAVNTYHKTNWNMRSSIGWYVGYNFFIDVDGTVTQTRAIGEETVANVGHNCDVASRCDTISVCFAGNFNIELPSDAQIAAFKRLYDELQDYFPAITVTTHRNIQIGRSCPGDLMTDQYIQVRLLDVHNTSLDSKDVAKQKEITKLMEQISVLQRLIEALKKLINK